MNRTITHLCIIVTVTLLESFIKRTTELTCKPNAVADNISGQTVTMIALFPMSTMNINITPGVSLLIRPSVSPGYSSKPCMLVLEAEIGEQRMILQPPLQLQRRPFPYSPSFFIILSRNTTHYLRPVLHPSTPIPRSRPHNPRIYLLL